MTLKHFAVVTAGVWVGTMIAPTLMNLVGSALPLPPTITYAASVAVGVILVDKFI
jgi:hypothetical protein